MQIEYMNIIMRHRAATLTGGLTATDAHKCEIIQSKPNMEAFRSSDSTLQRLQIDVLKM